jgi:hypothetical protein
MRKVLLVLLFAAIALPAGAQPQRPTPDEAAFARLPGDLQAMLQHLSPREALRTVDFARQNLIAVGVPHPTSEQLRATVARVIDPGYAPVEGASAGSTSFPPLSPLVSPYGLQVR